MFRFECDNKLFSTYIVFESVKCILEIILQAMGMSALKVQALKFVANRRTWSKK